MTNKRRKSKKLPKFMQPRYYAEFLHLAMTEEGREAAKRPRPADRFSRACIGNHHDLCSGYIDVDYTLKRATLDRDDCICHCHDSLVV